MNTTVDPAVESLLAFWGDAGVDTAFADAPVDRLASPLPELRSRAPEPEPSSPAPVRAAASAAPSGEAERARAVARACRDWTELAAAIAGFETALRPRSGATVIARGAERPALLVIGEGPSAEDEAAAAPFTGRIGVLLDRMLAAVGLGERALIMPTAFWRARDRTAGQALEAACAPFLHRAVELLQPHAVLLLGEPACRSLLGRAEPIVQAHGRWLAWTAPDQPEATPVPALPTFHPSFLLQHPGAKKRSWGDLLTLSERFPSVNHET